MRRHTALIASLLLALALTGCSSQATREAMTPQGFTVAKHHPQSLLVKTAGGSDDSIADADLKSAIEDAVTQSRVFKSIIQGNAGDYELNVRITSLQKPIFGATFTVEMETAWSLIKTADRSVVMRKSVKSSGTATMGDAFAAIARVRMAVERAAQANIKDGLKAVAELTL
ncbi:hypothetical protein KI614_02045 [Dechloromonas denitrificans]|jgi:hypothetical protein|uniref:hypothetical protein n=1 Tax=Dechloromonas denitrificans TaxID=281362 RepID=UPI001CF89BD3|nr:hypothetical protein [Dechloromonas denitrificans]UCV12050.1 hypothetical protein KI614_02045 [Dechloromonas denitrificans]